MNSSTSSTARCTLLLLLFITTTMAQAQRWVHPAHSAGGVGSDYGWAYKANAAGDRYMTGYFSDSVSFGGRVLTSRGDTDIFLVKESTWEVQVGGTGHDEARDLAFDTAGNIYLTGFFTDSATFSSTGGRGRTVNGSGETIFLAKYNSSGVLQWVQTGINDVGGISQGNSVAVDSVNGSVYLAAITQQDTTFTSANGSSHVLSGVWTWHMALVRYDTNGNFQWGELNSAAPNSDPDGVAIDASHNVYVTGWFEGSVTFSSADGNSLSMTGFSQPVQSPPDYPGDGFTVKYDANGNVKWASDIGGYKANNEGLCVSSAGNVSVVGVIGNIGGGTVLQGETLVTSQPAGTVTNLGTGTYTSPYNQDVVVLTYDPSGVLLTAVRKGGSNDESGNGIACSGNDVYVAADTADTSTSAHKLVVAKFTGATLDWVRSAPGAGIGRSGFSRISVAPGGTLLVTGEFTGSATFGSTSLESAGAEDIFFARLRTSN